MSLRSFDPCFGFSRRIGAIAVSCFLLVFAAVFVVLCFSQLSAGSTSPGSIQGAFAVASILQVVLVALASTIIFASWKENVRLIRLSAYSTAIHLVLNLITLVCLLVALAPTVPCTTGRPRCSKLVAAKPAWDVLSAFILTAQLYLSLIVFSYFLSLKDRPWRPYVPEISSRSLSTPHSYTSDYKHLLSNPEPYHNVEMGAIGSATTTLSFSIPEPEPGYGGGMRTYEEAEQNEKARLRREMETEGNGAVSFPIPSTSDTGILTPLGHQWRDGDLPPYAS